MADLLTLIDELEKRKLTLSDIYVLFLRQILVNQLALMEASAYAASAEGITVHWSSNPGEAAALTIKQSTEETKRLLARLDAFIQNKE